MKRIEAWAVTDSTGFPYYRRPHLLRADAVAVMDPGDKLARLVPYDADAERVVRAARKWAASRAIGFDSLRPGVDDEALALFWAVDAVAVAKLNRRKGQRK